MICSGWRRSEMIARVAVLTLLAIRTHCAMQPSLSSWALCPGPIHPRTRKLKIFGYWQQRAQNLAPEIAGLWVLGTRPRMTAEGASKSYTMLAMVAMLALFIAPAHAAPPQRIVSLNLCTDQILVDLVARERIAAVTHLAADATVSAAPEKLAGLAVTRGAAEDVLARDPDLIIAGAYTTPATVDLLRRLGRRVVVVPLPDTVAGVRALIGEIAAAVEAPVAGAELVAALDARIERVQAQAALNQQRPAALVYQVNNYVSGSGTLVDEALQIAGYRNAAAMTTKFANGKTDLESIVKAPPDVMVLATRPDAYATVVGDNLRHPALARLMQRVPSVVLPWPLWLCGTHHIATAIEQLAVARLAVLEKRPSSQ